MLKDESIRALAYWTAGNGSSEGPDILKRKLAKW